MTGHWTTPNLLNRREAMVFGGGSFTPYMLNVTPAASGPGYVGTFNIGLQII